MVNKTLQIYFSVLNYFIYLFLERGEGREKDRERNINVCLPLTHPLLGTWPATQVCALTGNRAGDLLVHRPALDPLSHTSWVRIHVKWMRLYNKDHFKFYVFFPF